MYLLITVIVALFVGLVLVALVQVPFGRPEPGAGHREGTPRFSVVRRGYDISEVEAWIAAGETDRAVGEDRAAGEDREDRA